MAQIGVNVTRALTELTMFDHKGTSVQGITSYFMGGSGVSWRIPANIPGRHVTSRAPRPVSLASTCNTQVVLAPAFESEIPENRQFYTP